MEELARSIYEGLLRHTSLHYLKTMTNSKYIQDFCKLLQCNTISNGGDFATFHKVLREVFPLVHARLQKVDLSLVAGERDYTNVLLFKWEGANHDKPLVLMAHQDVVPVDEAHWDYPPFDATVVDDKVYARGAIDCKNTLFCTMMAVEELLANGELPPQDVYLSYSPNEEISGTGTQIVRDYFVSSGITPFLVVDEGGALMKADGEFIKKDLLMVGATEKGYADVKFIAKGDGGHASKPPYNTPIARIAKFVNYCENHHVFKPRCTKIARQMLYKMGDAFPFGLKLVSKTIGLTGGLVASIASGKLAGRKGAMIFKTTMAFTTTGGGKVSNAIPDEAYVTANIRFLQGDTSEKCFAKLTKLASKFDLEMQVIKFREASPVVDVNGEGYKLFESVAKQVYPQAVIAPFLMFAGTDCRHLQPIAKHAIRCTPILMTFSQLDAMHGNNENLTYTALDKCIEFFKNLIQANK
ncbi:MAG: M20/M25/M40 family metallo-hydrolase [Clostridia bacterium]|nr:M20/M25/M40 family metallo-hydrolase [Clostridia bacterium]